MILKSTTRALFILFILQTGIAAQDSTLIKIFESDDLISFTENFGSAYENDHLHLSISTRSQQIFQFLLDTEASPDDLSSEGFTPLHTAILNSNSDAFFQLIELGANVNLQRNGGLESTPLMYAVSDVDTIYSSHLISVNADVNIPDINADPALNWAAYYGHYNQLKLLLKHGADIQLNSIHGNAAEVILRLWHPDSTLQIFRETEMIEELSDENKHLLTAIQSDNVDAVKELLENGIDPNSEDGLNNPLIHIVASLGNIEILKEFVLKGATINSLNRVGQAPITWAARNEHKELVKFLIENGADATLMGEKYQLSPLIGAAVGGNVEIGELLLKQDVEIDHRDLINNASALHWAILNSNTDFAKLLLSNNAEFHSNDENDFSAYNFAQMMGNQELIDLMESMMD
jgi:ankyrin repeat protein